MYAGQKTTTGGENTFLGNRAATENTTGNNNTAIGYLAYQDGTTGVENVALGREALANTTTSSYNTALGSYSLLNNTTGANNTAIGRQALYDNTTGTNNIAIGLQALENNTTASSNIGIGPYALQTVTTGAYNTVIGYEAAQTLDAGSTTAVGYKALEAVTSGNSNTGIGYEAGRGITTGGTNVCIGNQAGFSQITTESSRLFIARSNTAAGNAATWIHGGSDGACYQGDNTTTWSTTSDRRLKKNITDSSKGLAEIDQLRVANFEYRTEEEIDMSEFPKADGPHQVVIGSDRENEIITGVIAQEVEAILPECIQVSDKGAKTVQTDPILWALVNAVKELSTKVKALEGG